MLGEPSPLSARKREVTIHTDLGWCLPGDGVPGIAGCRNNVPGTACRDFISSFGKCWENEHKEENNPGHRAFEIKES